MDKESIQIARDFLEAFSNNDTERLKSLVHPNYSVGSRTRDSYTIIEDEMPYFEPDSSEKNEIELLLLRMKKYHQGLSEFSITFKQVNAVGGDVWADADFKGIHTGPFFGITPSNNPILIRGFFHLKIKEGKLYKADWLYDTVSLLKQFGKSIEGNGSAEKVAEYLELLNKMGLTHSSTQV